MTIALDHDRRNKEPRPLSQAERARLEEFVDSINYSPRSGQPLRPSQSALLILVFDRYSDDEFEYRHVQLPKQMLKAIPKDYFDPAKGTLKLLWEEEWRGLGITQVRLARGSTARPDGWWPSSQSLGWEHYEVHEPEPHILLFKWV
jgi:cyclin-dependent kinase regulatory subunit CKS1